MRRFAIGIILIALGVFFVLNQFFHFAAHLWPLGLLIPGIIFFFVANRQYSGVYIPATLLTMLGLFFYFNELTSWAYHDYLWWFYTGFVSLSFFVSYWFSKIKEYLIPGFILLGVTAIQVFVVFRLGKYWPFLLIGLGIYLIVDWKRFNSLFNKSGDSGQ